MGLWSAVMFDDILGQDDNWGTGGQCMALFIGCCIFAFVAILSRYYGFA